MITKSMKKSLIYQMQKAQRQAYRVAIKLRREAKRDGKPLPDTEIRFAVKG